jgi:hypothetical protein
MNIVGSRGPSGRQRLAACLLAVVLAGVTAAGCGGDAESSSTATGAEGGAAPVGARSADGGKRGAITRAQALRLARAVNLRASDLPYFEVQPEDEGDEDPEREARLERRFDRCLGAPRGVAENLAEKSSKTYGTGGAGGGLSVQSEVEIAPSAALARRRARLLRRGRTLTCLKRLYVPVLEEEGSPDAEIGAVSIARLPVPRPDPERAIGFRVSARITVGDNPSQLTAFRPGTSVGTMRTLPAYVDVFAFVAGPAEVTLTATGIPDPVSRALEGNLLRLLHERALEHLP